MIPQMSGKATNEILREIYKQSDLFFKKRNLTSYSFHVQEIMIVKYFSRDDPLSDISHSALFCGDNLQHTIPCHR